MFSHAYDWVKNVQSYWLRNSEEELISIELERVRNFPERSGTRAEVPSEQVLRCVLSGFHAWSLQYIEFCR